MSLYDNSSILDDLKNEFRHGNMVTKLIMINIGIFLAGVIIRLPFWIMNESLLYDKFMGWFYLPSAPGEILFQPWTFFTYMFLHGGFFHILFNMIVLYFFGKILHQFLGNRKILPVYIMGGLAGALLYIFAYNLFPVLTENGQQSYLLGASAAVMAIMLAAAALRPNYEVVLVFLGAVKIKYIALFFVLIDLITIEENTGGHIAHLGGALFGFLFIYQLNNGKDWSVGFNSIVDSLVSYFKISPKGPRMAYKRKPSKAKVSKEQSSTRPSTINSDKQARMDEILDKIAASGYDSLSKDEKEFLFKVSHED